MRKNLLIIIPLAIFLALASHLARQSSQSDNDTSTLKVKPLGGDFEINSSQGKVNLTQFRDKVVILYFGYTFCPDICPTTLSAVSRAIKSLDPSSEKQVEVMFISLDPKRDTFARLDEYTAFFHKNIHAYTDSEENLASIAKLYGVSYRLNEPEKGKTYYTIDHSTQTFLVNKKGELVEFIQHGTSSEDMTKLIKKYL